MTRPDPNRNRVLATLLILGLSLGLQIQAQQRGGGGGGGGGGASRGSSTSRTYQGAGTIGDAYFSIDPETRRVVVISDEETAMHVSLVLSNLDRPKPQVLIKVVFLEIARNDASDIGIEGGWGNSFAGSITNGSAVNGFGLSGLSAAMGTNLNRFGQPLSSFAAASPMTSPGAGLYQILGTDYQVTLRAIAQAGKAKVLSRPSILARNNQPATITVGQSVPLITSVRYDNYGNAINSVSYQDVGVILKVTPFITPDGLVEMIVSPQISSIDSTLSIPISTGVSAPVIDVRSADTVVVTPDGQTVVIGGLISTTKAQNIVKIPWLGDIPLMGNLFRRKQTSETKTELLIFLTPHVVQAPAQLAAVSDIERTRANLPKSFSEEELNRFFDTLPAKKKTTP